MNKIILPSLLYSKENERTVKTDCEYLDLCKNSVVSNQQMVSQYYDNKVSTNMDSEIVKKNEQQTTNKLYPEFDIVVIFDYSFYTLKKRKKIKASPYYFFFNSSGLVSATPTNKYVIIWNIFTYKINNKFEINYASKCKRTREEIINILSSSCCDSVPVNIITNDKKSAAMLNYLFKSYDFPNIKHNVHRDCLKNQKNQAKVKVWCVSEKSNYNHINKETFVSCNNQGIISQDSNKWLTYLNKQASNTHVSFDIISPTINCNSLETQFQLPDECENFIYINKIFNLVENFYHNYPNNKNFYEITRHHAFIHI